MNTEEEESLLKTKGQKHESLGHFILRSSTVSMVKPLHFTIEMILLCFKNVICFAELWV